MRYLNLPVKGVVVSDAIISLAFITVSNKTSHASPIVFSEIKNLYIYLRKNKKQRKIVSCRNIEFLTRNTR